MTTGLNVRHNEEEKRFEADVDGGLAFAEYTTSGKSTTFTHTEVPEEAEGQGVGSGIVKFALDHAKSAGWTVVPQCPFVKTYIERHSEYGSLVKAE